MNWGSIFDGRRGPKAESSADSTSSYRVVLSVSFIVAALSISAIGLWLGLSGLEIRRDMQVLAISADGGDSFITSLQLPKLLIQHSDTPSQYNRSPLVMFEDGRRLVPAHTLHDDIRNFGGGRYSDYNGTLRFSSSDHTDPRRNGRHYLAITRGFLHPIAIAFITLPTLIAALWWADRVLLPIVYILWKRAATPMSPLRVAIAYSAIVAGGLTVFSFVYYCSTVTSPKPGLGSSELRAKVAYYKEHANDFDVVFLGDSRTYCGVHPDLLDPYLGRRSINLGMFSTWFPLQYSVINDILPYIPPGSTVVWSVGHQNFDPTTTIQEVYPIGLWRTLEYISWGVRNPGLFDNVATFNPLLVFFHQRGVLRRSLFEEARQPARLPALISQTLAAPAFPSAPPAAALAPDVVVESQRLISYYRSDPRVSSVQVLTDNDRITSVVLYLSKGSYYRIELDHAFFRHKQAELAPAHLDDQQAAALAIPPADPALWHIFEAALDAFKKRRVHLVINEMEEAPWTYGSPIRRELWHRWLERTLRPALEQYGVPFIAIDFSKLGDSDYFDYNHLNSDGIAKFTPMFAAQLQAVLSETSTTQ